MEELSLSTISLSSLMTSLATGVISSWGMTRNLLHGMYHFIRFCKRKQPVAIENDISVIMALLKVFDEEGNIIEGGVGMGYDFSIVDAINTLTLVGFCLKYLNKVGYKYILHIRLQNGHTTGFEISC